ILMVDHVSVKPKASLSKKEVFIETSTPIRPTSISLTVLASGLITSVYRLFSGVSISKVKSSFGCCPTRSEERRVGKEARDGVFAEAVESDHVSHIALH